MKRKNIIYRLLQWAILSGIVCVLWLIGTLWFQRFGNTFAIIVLEPWFLLCRNITPISWQTRGNILIGLTWFISGVVIYSMLLGGISVIALTVINKLRKPNNSIQGTNKDQK